MPRPRLLLVLVAALPAIAADRPLQSQMTEATLSTLVRASQPSGAIQGAALEPQDHGCDFHTIACGQTISSTLKPDACPLDDGSLIDFYRFSGEAGQTVTVDMRSTVFDTFLLLLDPSTEIVATDDDGGSGSDSHLVHTLDQTSSEWSIGANAFLPDAIGDFTLSLQCSGDAPPPPPPSPDGFFFDPSYPDFRFRVTIGDAGDPRTGNRESDCQPETVCVSGALPGRSELFIRILGPRPNGFLWPTIVRFTPARVVVDIRQETTGQLKTYMLPAVPPGVDELVGLQDRTGFMP